MKKIISTYTIGATIFILLSAWLIFVKVKPETGPWTTLFLIMVVTFQTNIISAFMIIRAISKMVKESGA